jgi:hypothetical protein
MQVEVVSKLVPGIIIVAQTLGEGRLILLVYEWRAKRALHRYAVYLIENYRKVNTLHDLSWDVAMGFLRACHGDAKGDNDTWWKLICGRVREKVGNVAP